MKRNLTALLSLLTCLLLLTACAGNTQESTGNAQKNSPDSVPPAADTESSAETPSAEPSGESTDEGSLPPVPMPSGEELSAEAMEEYTNWFAQMDFNGLLRFPYDNSADPTQIAPYLDFLFYDNGETDISDEEYALLDAAGMFLELDEFRLTRTFVVDYLVTWLDMSPEDADAMLSEGDPFGVYLPETDAWYACHGDTAWMPYTFERGISCPESASVKLYYTNPFLTVVLEDGEVDFLTDQPMVVTISIEGGERRVLSNEILSSPYN